jgi:tetratricopeptide (TPR) repeat protein
MRRLLRRTRIITTSVVLIVLALHWSTLVQALDVNLAVLAVSAAVGKPTEPLYAQDLFGQRRSVRHDLERLIEKLDTLAMHAQTSEQQARALRIRTTVLLLIGQPERVIGGSGGGRNDLSKYVYAMAYGQLQEWDQVQSILRQIPHAAQALANMGNWAWTRPDAPDARTTIAALELSLRMDEASRVTSPDVYRILSSSYESSGDLAKAAESAYLWVQMAPDDCAPSIRLAGLRIMSGDSEGALALLNQLEIKRGRECPGFAIRMGQVSTQLGDPDQAIVFFREAVLQQPGDPWASFYLGEALFEHGQYVEAIPYLKLAQDGRYPNLQKTAQNLLEQISREAPN